MVAELAQARVSRLRHAALLYAGPSEFAVGVARFVETAARAGDPVLVACAAPGLGLLRPQLNGHGGLVTWADMRGIGLKPVRAPVPRPRDLVRARTGLVRPHGGGAV